MKKIMIAVIFGLFLITFINGILFLFGSYIAGTHNFLLWSGFSQILICFSGVFGGVGVGISSAMILYDEVLK